MVFSKLWTMAKGHINDAGEAVVDANLMTILDQEIREAKEGLENAKKQKSKLAGLKLVKSREVDELQEKYDNLVSAAKKAKAQDNMKDAEDFVNRAMQVKDKIGDLQKQVETYAANVDKMEAKIRQAENRLETLKSKVETAKANEAVLNATKAASTSSAASNNGLANATDSLDRLLVKQASDEAMLEAAEEEERISSGSDLEERMERYNSGNDKSAKDFLDSL